MRQSYSAHKKPHTSPSRASYGVSIVILLKKIDRYNGTALQFFGNEFHRQSENHTVNSIIPKPQINTNHVHDYGDILYMSTCLIIAAKS